MGFIDEQGKKLTTKMWEFLALFVGAMFVINFAMGVIARWLPYIIATIIIGAAAWFAWWRHR